MISVVTFLRCLPALVLCAGAMSAAEESLPVDASPIRPFYALHARQEFGRFRTAPQHIASQKIALIESGATELLRRARLVGSQTARWAEVLRLFAEGFSNHGQRKSDYIYDDSFTFRVYGATDDAWSEDNLTAENAPAVCHKVSAMRGTSISMDAPPVGHLSFSNMAGYSAIDVTRFVREHADTGGWRAWAAVPLAPACHPWHAVPVRT